MIQKKNHTKDDAVRVTFELPAEIAETSVAVVGDFNDWDPEKTLMTLNKKKGVWSKTISLKPGRPYEFRYYIDERRWENDEAADGYAPNPYFSENSVLEV